MARGLVEIMGVTTRRNRRTVRACEACLHRVTVGANYERVKRLEGNIESYHVGCFVDEFGPREAYGA